MEGVYRRGEFYLRWLERGSSLYFGTQIGRFITRNFLLPFGGAFALLFTLQVCYLDYLQPAALVASGKETAKQAVTEQHPEDAVKGRENAKPGAAPAGEDTQKQAAPKDEDGRAALKDVNKQAPVIDAEQARVPAESKVAVVQPGLFPWYSFLLVGVFLWGLMHVTPFRASCVLDSTRFPCGFGSSLGSSRRSRAGRSCCSTGTA